MGKAIGIDLGTTNSCVAVYEGGQATVLPNAEGGRTTPSVVGFDHSGGVLVGAVAKRQAIANPSATIASAKRFIGRKAAEVQEEAQLLPYEVISGDSGDACLRVSGRSLKPQQVSAYVLEKLKSDAEAYLGEQVSDAVITVPAYFNNSQREATREAAAIAGLKALRIVNEPTAAALAYGLDKSGDRRVLVFDLGGGTFDVSILEIGEGIFEVRSTAGDNHLGGDDFDRAIVEWLVEDFRKQHQIDLHTDPLALQRLWEAAERAKVELSTLERTTIALPYLTAGPTGPIHLEKAITRSQVTTLCSKLLQRVQAPVEQALADAGLDTSQLDAVVLVGGMTRMPAVQAAVRTITGKEPQQGVNPDEVVAIGAAIQAGVITGTVSNVILLDVTPLSLGVEVKGGIFSRLLDRNTTIPTRRSELYTTSHDNQEFVEIHVLQGESDIAIYNKSLGRFRLNGIPLAPKGNPQIEVTFDIDSNGIIAVSARDVGTGTEQQVTISGSDVPPAEVERLLREADLRRDEAAKLRRLVEARERADVVAEAGERALGQYTQLLPASELREAQAALDALKAVRAEEIALPIEQALHRFGEASKKLVAAAASHHQAPEVPGVANPVLLASTSADAGETSDTTHSGAPAVGVVETADLVEEPAQADVASRHDEPEAVAEPLLEAEAPATEDAT